MFFTVTVLVLFFIFSLFFFFNDTATTEIYTLSLHDALPIYAGLMLAEIGEGTVDFVKNYDGKFEEPVLLPARLPFGLRSEEHTSELQSLAYLVCRLLLEKKKKKKIRSTLRIQTRVDTN